MRLFTTNNNSNNCTNSGFTLVELLIVLGVFAVLTAVILSNYRTYNTNAVFANASENIVLALRQAQVYGSGSKAGSGACGGMTVFDCSYGVYFVQGANGVKVFADTNNNRVYNSGEEIGLESTAVTWASTISITNLLCDGLSCSTGAASVTFRRPNPTAFIADVAPYATTTSAYTSISIAVTDANTGRTATTTITKAGQISIQ